METALPRGAFSFIFLVGMNKFIQAGFFAMAAAMVAGCSTQPKVYYHAGDENPPDFLAGPMAVLLTNVDGFSAKMTGTISASNGSQRTLSGDLLGRQGTLIYQPENAAKGKRVRSEGGMFFIWNESSHSGFVLSDPLQAFAPAFTNVSPTNVVLVATGAAEEEANGHLCRRFDAVVQCNDGSAPRFRLWEAQDAKGFPVRIESPPGPGQMTLNFSNLHLQPPPAELFDPPDGFMKYETPVALMNELIIRQVALAKENLGHPIGLSPEGGPNMGNWRPSPTQ
jgi:hypothetical protein